jgi:drug/metabolite transporter (DMT)-like permease
LVIVVAAILGGNFIALKIGLRNAGPATIQAFATVLASTAMFALARSRGAPWILPVRHLALAGVVGCLFTVGAALALAFGVDRVDAGLAAFIISLTTVITVVLRWLWLKSATGRWGVVGVSLGVGGVAIISYEAGSEGPTQLVGVLLLLLAAGSWSISLLVIEEWAARVRIESFVAWQAAIGAPLVIGIAWVVEGLNVIWAASLVLAIVYIGVLSKAVSLYLQMTVVRRSTATVASVISLLVPVIATVLGMIVLGERMTLRQWVGAALILSAVWLVGRSSPRESGVVPVT